MLQNYKIAIISFGHEGSSIPLANAIASKGVFVDYYLIAKNGVIKNVEGVDSVSIRVRRKEGTVPENSFPMLSLYLKESSVSLKYVNTFSEFKSVPVLRRIMPLLRRQQIKKICWRLNKYDYDKVILVGRYKETDDIIDYCQNLICGYKIVSLHEVCNHISPTYNQPSRLLKFLFNQKIHINVFSNNSYNDILNYEQADKDFLSCIPFGTFDTFKYLKNKKIEGLPDDYILFYGMISPYKGLNVLVDAIKHSSSLREMKTVIAGSGYDASLDSIKNDKSFFIINRYLANDEIATLIRHARVVVCPYLSMSQSGITQTTFAFGTPIVATALQGFNEVIEDGVNGLLVPPEDAVQLARAIEKVYSDRSLYSIIKKGAEDFAIHFPKYNWSAIADAYLSSFNNE